MATDDFEVHFGRLGLSHLPGDVACDVTFSSDASGATVLSGARGGPAPASAGTGLPRLDLGTPAAAGTQGADPAELVAVQVLGEGGMGRVVLARQLSLGREVAVKVLRPGTHDAHAAEALVDEARTTGSLEHPNVVPVYALGRDAEGAPALVMKRIDGVSWKALLEDEAHPAWARIAASRDRLEANLEVLIQVCNAIAHAHQRGVIHRDLKPANILIGELGEVYVADWGIAIQKASRRPGPPRLVGTPAYLAPEMVCGDPMATDERTDVYLLGGTLHHVLTQKPPHAGASLHEVLQHAWAAAPPTFPSAVAPALAALCARALAADPEQRFPSALALRDALRVFLVQRGSVHLLEAAVARLGKLEALSRLDVGGDLVRGWHGLVSECRFAFLQALEADAHSDAARRGLAQCLTLATARELQRGSAVSARSFLAQMAAPPADFERRLRELEALDTARTQRDARHRQFAHQTNPRVFARQRNAAIVALAIVIALGALGPVREALADTLGRWGRLVPMGLMCGVYLVLLVIGRRALLATRVNRQLMAVVGVGFLAMELGRVQFTLMNLPVHVNVVHDGWLLTAALTICAFLLHWIFAAPAVVFLIATAVVGVAPAELATAIFSSFSAVALIAFVGMFRFWQRDVERELT